MNLCLEFSLLKKVEACVYAEYVFKVTTTINTLPLFSQQNNWEWTTINNKPTWYENKKYFKVSGAALEAPENITGFSIYIVGK